MGTIAGCIGVLIFFLVWLGVIALFACLGPRKVGLFSGRQPRKPRPGSGGDHEAAAAPKEIEGEGGSEQLAPEDEKPAVPTAPEEEKHGEDQPDVQDLKDVALDPANEEQGDDQELQGSDEERLLQWEKENAAMDRNLKWSRIAVLIFGLGIIICVILMIFKGVDGLIKSVDETRNVLDQASSLTTEAKGLIDDYADLQDKVDGAVKNFDKSFAELCPAACNLTESEGLVCDSTILDSLPYAKEVGKFLNETDDHINKQLTKVSAFCLSVSLGPRANGWTHDALFLLCRLQLYNDIGEFQEIINDAKDATGSFDYAFYIAAIFGCLLCVVTLFIMVEVVLAWRKKAGGGLFQRIIKCCRRGFLIPIFVILVVLGMVFAIVFIWGSVTASDFCYGSPDKHLVDVLDETEDLLGSTIYKFALYYITGCKVGNPTDFIDKVVKIVAFAKDAYKVAVGASEADSSAVLQTVCGAGASPEVLANITDTVGEVICDLGNALYKIEDFFACDKWRPLYTIVSAPGSVTSIWLALALTLLVSHLHSFSMTRFVTMQPQPSTGSA